MSVINFTVLFDAFAAQADSADDGADADVVPLVGEVVFTPVLADDRLMLAPGYDPRPAGLKPRPITGYIDSDGRLKAARGGPVGVRLWANDPVLGRDALFYRVAFSLTTPIGEPVAVTGGFFEAPSADLEVNLADVLQPSGHPGQPITKVAPGGVRLTDDGQLVFTFGGADIPDPFALPVISNSTSALVGDGASTEIEVVHGFGTLDVSVSVFEVDTGEEVDCDVTRTDGDTVTLGFGSPPGADALRCVVIGTAFGLGSPTPTDSLGITDATAVGRAVLTAADEAAARDVIGAVEFGGTLGTPTSGVLDGCSGYPIAADTHAATSKSTPVDADELFLVDSAASYGAKKLTVADLKALIYAYIVSSAPEALNTLDELAAALGDDANYAATITSLLALKAPLNSPTLVTPALGTPSSGNLTNCTAVTAATASTIAQRDSNANLTADAFIATATSTATAGGTTTLTIDSSQVQVFTGSTTQTVQLPTTSVVAGMTYTIINNSTGSLTVQSSGANTIVTIATTRYAVLTAAVDTPTTAANWKVISLSDSNGASTVVQRDANSWAWSNGFAPIRASVATAAGTTTLSAASVQAWVFTGSTTQTVKLPTTSILAGMEYTIINQSSGDVTVQSSAANTIGTLSGASSPTAKKYIALQDTPTAATHWREI